MGMDIIDLFQKVEKAFGIQIPNREAEKASTVRVLQELVIKSAAGDETFIREKIIEIIANYVGINKDKITPDKRFTDDLGLD
jgi:acyl carrier protein